VNAWVVGNGHIDVPVNVHAELGAQDGPDPRALACNAGTRASGARPSRTGSSRTPDDELHTTDAPYLVDDQLSLSGARQPFLAAHLRGAASAQRCRTLPLLGLDELR
jgi:hypothetical protein